jgi:hypothetical protein
MARLGRPTPLLKLHQYMAELALLDLDTATNASASAASISAPHAKRTTRPPH